MATPTTDRPVQLRAGVTPRIMRLEFICQASNVTGDFLIDGTDCRRFQRYDVEVYPNCWVSLWIQTAVIADEDFVMAFLQMADPTDNARITYRGIELSLHAYDRFMRRDQISVTRSVLRNLGLDD